MVRWTRFNQDESLYDNLKAPKERWNDLGIIIDIDVWDFMETEPETKGKNKYGGLTRRQYYERNASLSRSRAESGTGYSTSPSATTTENSGTGVGVGR